MGGGALVIDACIMHQQSVSNEAADASSELGTTFLTVPRLPSSWPFDGSNVSYYNLKGRSNESKCFSLVALCPVTPWFSIACRLSREGPSKLFALFLSEAEAQIMNVKVMKE